jgi:uncharacterized membrane protein
LNPTTSRVVSVVAGSALILFGLRFGYDVVVVLTG